MSFFDRLTGSSRSSGEDSVDPLDDLTLGNLREGYLVDYEMQTWTVDTHARYDYEGFPADEWTLRNGNDTRYLEHEEEAGETTFSLARDIEITDVHPEDAPGTPLRQYVKERGAPASLTYDGDRYALAEEGPATRTVGDDGAPQSLRYWVYEATGGTADEEDLFIALERFGENDWSAHAGRTIEPYEFDNILPGAS